MRRTYLVFSIVVLCTYAVPALADCTPEFWDDPARANNDRSYYDEDTVHPHDALDSFRIACEPPREILYVDADANGANDGSSWSDAYDYLQDALVDARSDPNVNEIRVAEGVYTPDSNSADPNGSGDRTATFQLINGVALKGGYAGYGEPDPNARDVVLFETILSGDLDGNDVVVEDPQELLAEPSRAENSYHVVTGSYTEPNAILDGFTITAGNANVGAYPDATCMGAGMRNESGSPTLTDCTFRGNSVGYGGGAMYNYDNSSPTLTACTFSRNVATAGGGMNNEHYSSPTLSNCTFSGNKGSYGGGMYNENNSSPTLTNCTFSGNWAGRYGGGMYSKGGSPTVTNCTFSGNSAGVVASGTVSVSNGEPNVIRAMFIWCTGGGMCNWASNPTITNCTFSGNSTGQFGGGMYNHGCSPVIVNCTFSGNSSEEGGGGMANNVSSNATVTNCAFSGNSDSMNGGGMYNVNGSSPTVTNCIFWGDTAPAGPEIYNYDISSTAIVGYSDIEGGYGGTGNIDEDPCFVDVNGPDKTIGTADDNLRLSLGSLCIDTGDNNSVPPDSADLDGDGNTTELIPYDLDGNKRIADGDGNTTEIVDMGAFEFPDECLKATAREYRDWVAWGKPDCWCYPRQCRGDADGIKTGPFPVAIPDLNMLRGTINKPDAVLQGIPNGLCCDFDHGNTGPFRVGIPDLGIIRRYINKPASQVPLCDEAPIYTGPYNFWTSP